LRQAPQELPQSDYVSIKSNGIAPARSRAGLVIQTFEAIFCEAIMRIKAPKTIVTFPRDGSILVYNYLTKDSITCAAEDVYWLTTAANWTDIDDILKAHPQLEPHSLRAVLQSLIETGMFIVEGSQQAVLVDTYEKSWEIGPAAALFHFSVIDNEYASEGTSTEMQRSRAEVDPSPVLFRVNSETAIILPRDGNIKSKQLLDVMKNRRSNRVVKKTSISLFELSECLFSGLGITGFVKTENAVLPLKMTPSGGARNPYEAYVWARNVDGIESGIYHYSALEHSLEKVATESNFSPSDLLAGQSWTNDMSAVIFLVADLKRTTWKYSDPNAYRVILIEAGHIAQNIMLTCTNHALTACPTAALCHGEISKVLSLGSMTETPIYALTIGHPEVSSDIYVDIDTVKNQHAA
jgi:SagB-type dehydrogenase family enzyme